jgi:hypothetical protein
MAAIDQIAEPHSIEESLRILLTAQGLTNDSKGLRDKLTGLEKKLATAALFGCLRPDEARQEFFH